MNLNEAAEIVKTAADEIYESEDQTLALSSVILYTLGGLLFEPAPEAIRLLAEHCNELARQRRELLRR